LFFPPPPPPRLVADELLTAEIDFSDQAIIVQELPGHVRAVEITVTLDFLITCGPNLNIYIYTVFVGVITITGSYNIPKCYIFILYLLIYEQC
jgi:hypothetical protein